MKKEELELIEKTIKEIKASWGDWEKTHSRYDGILDVIARHYEPKLMKRLDRLMKDASWWFA